MAQGFRLPAYEVPNKMLDLAPLSSALDGYQSQMNTNAQFGMQQKRENREQETFDDAKKQRAIDRMGKIAEAASLERDPARKASMMGALYKMHPEMTAKLQEQGLDPNNHDGVAQFIKSQVSTHSPLGEKAQLAQIDATNANASATRAQMGIAQSAEGRAAARSPHEIELLKAQAAQANKKDEISEITGQIMRDSLGIAPRQPAPQSGTQPQSTPGQAPAQPRLQPMSNQGEDPNGQPQLIQAQTADRAAPRPTNTEPTVSVFGKPMPAAKAQALAHAMLMNPQTKGLGENIQSELNKLQLQQPVLNELQGKIVHNVDNLSRLSQIKSLYRPEFQTIETQLAVFGAGLFDRSKTLRANLSPQQRNLVTEYGEYRQKVNDNINQYVKDITGAQMSEAEAKRLMNALPDVDKDGPTAFEAKLNGAIKSARLAVVRHNWLLRNGLHDVARSIGLPEAQDQITGSPYSLQNFERQMDQKRAQYFQEIKQQNPQADDVFVDRATKQRMRQEYGI